MPRRKQPKYEAPIPPIAKLDNVPGPESDADTLQTHYRRVQDAFATHHYEDVVETCHWCLDSEKGLAFSKTDQPRGTRTYCTARCANAYTAYTQKVVGRGKVSTTNPSNPADDEFEDGSCDPPPGAAKPTLKRDRKKARGGVPEPTETATDAESRLSRTTVRERESPPERKARVKKAAREDGMCSRGLHPITTENTYERDGSAWCRDCKKLNRAKYLVKKAAGG